MMEISELLKRQRPDNPNKHRQAQVERLAQIYRFNGIRHPIVLSKNSNTITKGHCRLLAAIECKLQAFPVEWQEYESPDHEIADVIADNSIAMWSDLDLKAINAELPNITLPSIDLLGIENFVVDLSEKPKTEDCPKCDACGQKIKKAIN